MTTVPQISVIIVSWNVAQALKRCLSSIFATHYPNLEIIVIDNASSNNSAEIVSQLKIRSIKLIRNSVNVGFPKAANQGLKESRGDYILLLNPDTRLPKDFFAKALEFAKAHPDMGVMGPKFTHPDGSPQGSVFPEPSIFRASVKYTPASTSIVNAVSGACLFFPRATLKKIGYLTEEVFMYYEDLDYCRRIRASHLKVYFNSDISIVHEHGASSSQSPLAQKYLWQSSLWYNGQLKHYLMWFISWTAQKLQKLLGGNTSTEPE